MCMLLYYAFKALLRKNQFRFCISFDCRLTFLRCSCANCTGDAPFEKAAFSNNCITDQPPSLLHRPHHSQKYTMSIVKSLATTIRETILNNTPSQVTWNWTHFGFGRTLLHLQPSGVGFPPTLTMTAMILILMIMIIVS